MSAKRKGDPYNFDPGFERAVVLHCSRSPRFWGAIGRHLDHELLGAVEARTIVAACRGIEKSVGIGPDSTTRVVQHIRSGVEEGKITLEQVHSVFDYLDLADEGERVTEEACIAEIKPILVRRLGQDAARAAMEEYGKGAGFDKTAQLIAKAKTIGDVTSSLGVKLGVGSYAAIEGARRVRRISTGCPDVDMHMGGGLRRGTLGLVVAGPGGKKSTSLTQATAANALGGLFVALATLELPIEVQLARIKACATGLPVDLILDEPEQARPYLEVMRMGPIYVAQFTAGASTFGDIEEWVRELEREEGRECELLVTDYGDKVKAPGKAHDKSGYSAAGEVFESMRLWAEKGKRWHLSASQSRRKDKTERKGAKDERPIDSDDLADSMHKIRIADAAWSLNPADEGRSFLWWMMKDRYAKDKYAVGPLPHDLDCARVSPVYWDSPVLAGQPPPTSNLHGTRTGT